MSTNLSFARENEKVVCAGTLNVGDWFVLSGDNHDVSTKTRLYMWLGRIKTTYSCSVAYVDVSGETGTTTVGCEALVIVVNNVEITVWG